MRKTIVVDTSAILAVLMGEPQKRKLEILTQGADLVAPTSLKWELGNALSAMFKRKMLSLKESELVLEGFFQIPIQFVDVDMNSTLRICNQYGLYAYDAYMIVCAKEKSAALLSLDSVLCETAKKCLVKTLEV